MKRWIWRALVFLLIGAVVNVAVAWLACLLQEPLQLVVSGTWTAPKWPAPVPASWPDAPVPAVGTSLDGSRPLGSVAMKSHRRSAILTSLQNYIGISQEEKFYYHVKTYGFPLRTLRCDQLYGPFLLQGGKAPSYSSPRASGLLAGFGIGSPRPWDLSTHRYVLPLVPLWAGLVINTAVFAILAAGIPLIARLAVRLRQLRHPPRGHCPKCGYDLAGVAAGVCPECATAVPVHPPGGLPARSD